MTKLLDVVKLGTPYLFTYKHSHKVSKTSIDFKIDIFSGSKIVSRHDHINVYEIKDTTCCQLRGNNLHLF